MKYKFFISSEKAWEAMYKAVSNAKISIYLEMYIFQNDMEKYNFFDLLKEKAKAGIQIKIILDSFGSASLNKVAIAELKSSGAEILFHSYLLHRTHRKVLIVDDAVAFVGGVNLHQTAQFWSDLMVRMRGALVKSIVTSFAKSYADAGGKDPILLAKNKKIILVKVGTWLVEHSPLRKNFSFKRLYKKHIGKARESVTLITPYFVPKRWLSASLHQAVLRGVDVVVMVPNHVDYFVIDRVNYFYMYRLSKLGIKFYLKSNMNHAKAMIIDGKEAMVGSQNLDFLSFDLNSEVGIFFTDTSLVSKLAMIAEKWKKDSVLFDHINYKPLWFDYLLSPLINLFSRIF